MVQYQPWMLYRSSQDGFDIKSHLSEKDTHLQSMNVVSSPKRNCTYLGTLIPSKGEHSVRPYMICIHPCGTLARV